MSDDPVHNHPDMAWDMAEQCGCCKFWKLRTDHAGKGGGGYCRRYPPFFPSALRVYKNSTNSFDVEVSSGFLNDAWPYTHQQSWCGEFRPLPPPPNSKE